MVRFAPRNNNAVKQGPPELIPSFFSAHFFIFMLGLRRCRRNAVVQNQSQDGGGLQVEYEAGTQSIRCAISNPHNVGGKSSPCVDRKPFILNLLKVKRYHLALASMPDHVHELNCMSLTEIGFLTKKKKRGRHLFCKGPTISEQSAPWRDSAVILVLHAEVH